VDLCPDAPSIWSAIIFKIWGTGLVSICGLGTFTSRGWVKGHVKVRGWGCRGTFRLKQSYTRLDAWTSYFILTSFKLWSCSKYCWWQLWSSFWLQHLSGTFVPNYSHSCGGWWCWTCSRSQDTGLTNNLSLKNPPSWQKSVFIW